MRRWSLFPAVLLAVLAAVCIPAETFALPGELYLTNWDRTDYEPIELSGFWKTVSFPRSGLNTGKLLPSWNQGAVISNLVFLNLSVYLPSDYPLLSVKFPRTFMSYLLYVNGRLQTTNEMDYRHMALKNPANIFLVQSSANPLQLTLVFYDRSSSGASPWNRILIGERSRISYLREYRLVLTSILLGIFLFTFLFNLSRSFLFSRDRMPSLIALSLVSLAGFFFTLITGSTLDMFPTAGREGLLRLTLFLFNLNFILTGAFLAVFCQNKLARSVSATFIAVSVILTAVSVPIPPDFLHAAIHVIYAFYSLFLLILTLIFLTDGFFREKVSFLYAASVLTVLVFLSLDYAQFIRHYENCFWLPFGLAVFSVFYSFLYSMTIAREMSLNRSLLAESERLKSVEQELRSKKEDLEAEENVFRQLKESIEKRTTEFLNNFTEREKEIIGLLLEGDSYNEIAGKLGISEKTVENHSHHIYRKSKVNGRGQLIKLFRNVIERTQQQ